MKEIYNDKNFIVSYNEDTCIFNVTYKDYLLKIDRSISFKNPNQLFQAITFNPKVIDIDEAYTQFKHICEQSPEGSFIGLLDGMTLLTLDKQELTQMRDNLTKIIDTLNKEQED